MSARAAMCALVGNAKIALTSGAIWRVKAAFRAAGKGGQPELRVSAARELTYNCDLVIRSKTNTSTSKTDN
jgi:hypothetical protein